MRSASAVYKTIKGSRSKNILRTCVVPTTLDYTTWSSTRFNIPVRSLRGNGMIVDSHLHIFPHLDGPCGFPRRADHLECLQFYMVGHGQPVRRLRDDSVVPNG